MTGHRENEGGAISIMAAAMLMAIFLATALAVDVGRVGYVSRDQQGVTDRAVLDAVTLLSTNAPADVLTLGDLHTAVEEALVESLARNNGASATTTDGHALGLVELGQLDPSTGTFLAYCSADYDPSTEPSCPDDATVASAIRAETESFVPFLFAIGASGGGRDVIKTSVAEVAEVASVSVGSEIAGLDDGLVDDVLEELLCSGFDPDNVPLDTDPLYTAPNSTCSISLGVAGYNGLISGYIALGDLLTELGIAAGAPDQVLDTDVTVVDLLTASVSAMDDAGSPAAIALTSLAAEIQSNAVVQPTVNLAEVLHVTAGSTGQVADGQVNLFGLVKTTAEVANGQNLVYVPDLGIAIPGVGSVTANLQVLEAAQEQHGPARLRRTNPGVEPATYDWLTKATTEQVALHVDTALDLAGTGLVGSLTSLIGGLGVVTVDVSDVTVPVTVELAAAEAALTDVSCDDPELDPMQLATTVTTQTTTDVVRALFGDGAEVELGSIGIEVRVPILGTLLAAIDLDITGMLDENLGGATADEHDFAGPYATAPQSTTGGVVDLGGIAASSLNVAVEVRTGGVLGPITGPTLTALVNTTVSTMEPLLLTLLGDLDSVVLGPLMDTLGIGVGNADTWINSVQCSGRMIGPLL